MTEKTPVETELREKQSWTVIAVLRALLSRIVAARLTLTEMRSDLHIARHEQWGLTSWRFGTTIGEANASQLVEYVVELQKLEDVLKKETDRLMSRVRALEQTHCEEFGTETWRWPNVRLGTEPRYEDDVYLAMFSFLDPDAPSREDWRELGRTISVALRVALERLQRYDALEQAVGRRDVPFDGHRLQWIESAGRWHLGGKALHAGVHVYLLTERFGWLGGRYESSNGGQGAHFHFSLGERALGGDFSLKLGEEHRLAWPSEVRG